MKDEKENLEKLKLDYDAAQLKIEYGDYADAILQYYSRVKSDNKPRYRTNSLYISHNSCYFDTETYELYVNPNDDKEVPLIMPYLIGLYHPVRDSKDIKYVYKVFEGVNAAPEFLKFVFSNDAGRKVSSGNRRILQAFNLDYDFHVLRPWISKDYPKAYIDYTLTDDKKFLFGDIKLNSRFSITLRDLGKGDTSKGSLRNYIRAINELTFNKDGTPRDETTSKLLHNALLFAGFDNIQSFEKLHLQDVKKVNMYTKDGNYYYGTSKADGVTERLIPHEQRTLVKKLDLEHELKYLEVDVKSLFVVNEEQYTFKLLATETLGLGEFVDAPRAISIPGFGKGLCEEYEGKYMTETYRVGVTKAEYKRQNDSYTGAFVAGNKDVTYIDEEVFKQNYPNKSFYDKKGLPRLKSYDVHSMYPGVMSTGLPIGHVMPTPPETGDYVIGHEVLFTKYWTKDIDKRDRVRGLGGKLYDWKPEYACLNNSFFGTNFEVGVIPNNPAQSKVYIEDSLGQLFDSMCNHHGVIVATRYQKVSKKLVPFVKKLYEIKCTTKDKALKAAVKLILNSLYGKMAERFKEHSIKGRSHIPEVIFENPHYFQTLKQEKIEGIKDLYSSKRHRDIVKRKIAPCMDIQYDSGFLIARNLRGRYNSGYEEMRESILAGCYITSRARWKLLSNVKKVIDTGNVFLYADTDSIKYLELTKCPLQIDKLDSEGKPIKEELGKGGYEGSFTHFGHPNKLKKYFMYNKDTNQWMVKTSGVTKEYLKSTNGEFDLEMIKTIYHPDNRVRVKSCRPTSIRNRWFQIVINDKSDFYFVYEDMDLPPTHILDKNVLKPCH